MCVSNIKFIVGYITQNVGSRDIEMLLAATMNYYNCNHWEYDGRFHLYKRHQNIGMIESFMRSHSAKFVYHYLIGRDYKFSDAALSFSSELADDYLMAGISTLRPKFENNMPQPNTQKINEILPALKSSVLSGRHLVGKSDDYHHYGDGTAVLFTGESPDDNRKFSVWCEALLIFRGTGLKRRPKRCLLFRTIETFNYMHGNGVCKVEKNIYILVEHSIVLSEAEIWREDVWRPNIEVNEIYLNVPIVRLVSLHKHKDSGCENKSNISIKLTMQFDNVSVPSLEALDVLMLKTELPRVLTAVIHKYLYLCTSSLNQYYSKRQGIIFWFIVLVVRF